MNTDLDALVNKILLRSVKNTKIDINTVKLQSKLY